VDVKALKQRAVGFDLKITWLAISRMYNNIAQQEGINTNIGFVLLHIDDEKGTPATKIAPMMGMESRSLTRMLAKMEDQGLIRREQDPTDGRMVRIFPTDLGLQAKAISKDVVISFNKDIYNAIPEEKLDVFFEVIDQINEVIKERNNHDN
jgi:DNA-binding MarR family transcriptional regulator